MSNIIKSAYLEEQNRRVIQNKSLYTPPLYKKGSDDEANGDKESSNHHLNELEVAKLKKVELMQEINDLEQHLETLHDEIEKQKLEAQTEIDQWWQQKNEELQQLTAEVKSNAFNEGYEEGRHVADTDYEQKLVHIEQIVQEAYAEKTKIIEQGESFLLALAVKIAEKIVCDTLQAEPDKVLPMIRKALEQVNERKVVSIHFSPEHYPIIKNYYAELQQYVDADTDLKIHPDTSCEGYGCVIHTPQGSYDLMLDHQLDEVKKQLLAYYEECATHDNES